MEHPWRNTESVSYTHLDVYKRQDEREVSIAGRIMSKRRHGKICFLDLRDSEGNIQVFARKDVLEDKYEDVKGIDIGDIVGVKGIVFKTEAGEITVRATDITLLSNSLQILPEKFHGLKDPVSYTHLDVYKRQASSWHSSAPSGCGPGHRAPANPERSAPADGR